MSERRYGGMTIEEIEKNWQHHFGGVIECMIARIREQDARIGELDASLRWASGVIVHDRFFETAERVKCKEQIMRLPGILYVVKDSGNPVYVDRAEVMRIVEGTPSGKGQSDAIADEREACARIADEWASRSRITPAVEIALAIAAAIRERGEP